MQLLGGRLKFLITFTVLLQHKFTPQQNLQLFTNLYTTVPHKQCCYKLWLQYSRLTNCTHYSNWHAQYANIITDSISWKL